MNYQLTLDLGREGTRTYNGGESSAIAGYGSMTNRPTDVIKALEKLIRGLVAEFGEPYDPYAQRVRDVEGELARVQESLEGLKALDAKLTDDGMKLLATAVKAKMAEPAKPTARTAAKR